MSAAAIADALTDAQVQVLSAFAELGGVATTAAVAAWLRREHSPDWTPQRVGLVSRQLHTNRCLAYNAAPAYVRRFGGRTDRVRHVYVVLLQPLGRRVLAEIDA